MLQAALDTAVQQQDGLERELASRPTRAAVLELQQQVRALQAVGYGSVEEEGLLRVSARVMVPFLPPDLARSWRSCFAFFWGIFLCFVLGCVYVWLVWGVGAVGWVVTTLWGCCVRVCVKGLRPTRMGGKATNYSACSCLP